MTDSSADGHLHLIEATNWKDAVVTLLEPRSSYRPWTYDLRSIHAAEPVLVVLNTDPRTVLTELGRRGDDGASVSLEFDVPPEYARLALFDELLEDSGVSLEEAWPLVGAAASRVIEQLDRTAHGHDGSALFGSTSAAAARVLLGSGGVCSGCDIQIALYRDDARGLFRIHLVPQSSEEVLPQEDWPVVICHSCSLQMVVGGYSNFLDYRLSRHPECPRCAARRTQRIQFGLPSRPDYFRPWIDQWGCCVEDARWKCLQCQHDW